MAGLQLTFVNFKKNAFIMVEGNKQIADRFFIIRQGNVRISKEVEVVQEEGGNILGPGDFFGVVSTMSSHSHIESAQALTDVTLIAVFKEQFPQLITNSGGAIAMKIIMQFSKRMRYLDEALTRITLKNAAGDDPSHLFNVADYYAKLKQYNQAYYAYSRYRKYCPRGENFDRAGDIMTKIARFAQAVKLDFKPEEINRNYPKNAMIFSECEPGDELYIIQKGSVKITKIVDNKEVLLAVLKQSDIFGEMALLESKPRSASAIAHEDCVVMAVNRANFERMASTQPQIIARLTTLLAERIWLIYKQLANTLIDDLVGRAYDALLIQLEKNRMDVYDTRAYTFAFGPKELANMMGLAAGEVSGITAKLLENKNIQIQSDKFFVQHITEIVKEVESYRRMQKREQALKNASLRRF
ncbi:MAG: cyclic nucleotide-binding domain-containing protein [Treponema sp.]|jgi:CRP-like cAMP-binding protein|nr:cyclic nucleotide-binding domain-containing protein [Treponema sp.]